MMFHNWNELSINPSTRIKWRASLVPAAAVIPAPLAYIKIVAVKTFEVDTCPTQAGTADPVNPWSVEYVGIWLRLNGVVGHQVCVKICPSTGVVLEHRARPLTFTLNKLECLKQGAQTP